MWAIGGTKTHSQASYSVEERRSGAHRWLGHELSATALVSGTELDEAAKGSYVAAARRGDHARRGDSGAGDRSVPLRRHTAARRRWRRRLHGARQSRGASRGDHDHGQARRNLTGWRRGALA